MHSIDLRHASWYRALTLTERLASLPENRCTGEDAAVDWGGAERRLARWRDQYPFSADCHFARRLEADRICEHDLRRLLGEPAEAVRDRCSTPPDWLLKLERAFSRPDSPRIFSAGAAGERPHAGFLAIIEPVVSQGRELLSEGIELLARERGPLPFDRHLIEQALYEPLPERLIQKLDLAMTLELHVSRLKGELAGDTPEERFQIFVNRMREREHAIGFLLEYPVLARQLVLVIDQWVTYSLEFIRHLANDYDTIKETFSPEADLGSLTGLAADLGDTHRGGRSVQIAQFSSGVRIVYKPRDLGVDVHFQELLAWLNERGDHPPFRTHAILNRGTYGWVEFVAQEGCTSSEEIRRFYRRQGGYLALLYAIEATDFHYQNLIAAREQPVLIDLECLFQPRWKNDGVVASARITDEAFSQSVLRVGLLPVRTGADDQIDGVDLSALGSVAGQKTRDPIPFWEDAGTDAMRLARKRMAMTGSQNRPMLDGEAATPLAYSEEIGAGFTEIYRVLQENRECLLSPEGVLGRFQSDEVRVLVRDTQGYAHMLRESVHPDLLRDALDRDRFFDNLWARATTHPKLVIAFPAERDDLLRGDIPMLKSRPGSRGIWNSDNERIADDFHEPAMASVHRRLRELSDEDHARQLWFIRASLATLARGEDRPTRSNPGFGSVGPETEAGSESFLAAARAVGDRLASIALRDDQETTWIGLVNPFYERQLLVQPLGLSLYDGQPGVLLFLAYLGALTGDAGFTSLAHAALVSLRRMVDGGRSGLKSIGYAVGWGGIIYTYGHLAALWNRPELLTEAEELVDLLPTLIDHDDALDVTAGAAGCIGSLISLYRTSPNARTLEVAVRCGDQLLARAQTMNQGIAWNPRTPSRAPLTGFAHGAAGIAWALGELADLTGEARFHTAERSAIAYERSLFSAQSKNWPDLRDHGGRGLAQHHDQPSFTVAWCHGAPGIGLARILSRNRLNLVETRTEIDAALETTLAHGFGVNHSLCHGDLGNLETLLQAAEKLADPRWRAEAARMGAATLESIRRNGWICGVPSGVETPGLMQGLAGIGYGLLRLADPRRTPSVLAVEPPIKR